MRTGGWRHRLALAAAVVAVAVGATVVGPALGNGTAGAVVPAAPAVPGCSTPAPTTAAGYQAMFDAKNDRTWSGGDQAASVRLPDGRVLWLFADTVRGGVRPDGSRADGSDMVHNSLLLQDGGCLTAVPADAEAIPSAPSGEWYWPLDAVVQGSRLLVFCSRVRGTSLTDFASTGVDVALFDLAAGTPRFERVVGTAWSHTPETGAQFGKAFARDGGWLYSWSSRKQAGAFGKAVAVARVPVAQALEPAAWRYWTGSGWSSRLDRAAEVVPAVRGWSTSFSVYRSRGGWRALAKVDDVWGSEVVAARAAAPTGPFVRTLVGRAASDARTEVLYTALAHPELPLAGGRLLVSVCRNSLDLARVWRDADLYKPQFSSVPA